MSLIECLLIILEMIKDYLLKIVTEILYVGCGIQMMISWKLLFQAPKTFINAIFLALTLAKTLILPFQVYFLLEIGEGQWVGREIPPQKNIEDCALFLVGVTTVNFLDIIYNFGILFCRFLYTRHAFELTTDRVKLVHFLVCCVTGTFTLQVFLMQYGDLLVDRNNDFPLPTLDGVFCTSGTLDYDVSQIRADSSKITIHILAFLVLFALGNFHFTRASLAACRNYKIPPRRVNFITLKEQSAYFNLLLGCAILDRLFK